VTRFALARALVAAKGDVERARGLAMQARGDLAQARSAEVAVIDAFLGKQAPVTAAASSR
jgi:uncharacterized protein YqeY